ncbi:Uncharacterized protein PCOAH_00030220 [Plasmodium coatneyi]|uniref:Nudix hydrolase domain-containing protein n=1 Tax=Plasmodium coatneyi TaxID=208452 RepID=A0A1B1E0J8_9APIC|nr:Uncharacterized protein PCOAH_00030220 [Plasmodium coatneyi]ANQ08553.1 Uncharacterized protein PCOAH_00030220 [Plasmodium coatneyi]
MYHSGNSVMPGSAPLCNVNGAPIYMTGVKIRTFSPVWNGNYTNMNISANKIRKNVNGYLSPVVHFLGQRRFQSGAKRIGKKEYVRSTGQPNRLKLLKQYRCVAKGFPCSEHSGGINNCPVSSPISCPGGGRGGSRSDDRGGRLNSCPPADLSSNPSCDPEEPEWQIVSYNHPPQDTNPPVSSRLSDKTKHNYKAAGYFIVMTEVEQNPANNANQETNRRNINVKILLGYDPLKKQQNKEPLQTDAGSRMKGELSVPGGKRDRGEYNPVVTAYREFSEETLYLYNMFVSYFSHLHYVMKGITPGGEPTQGGVKSQTEGHAPMEGDPYELFLQRNFLNDITQMSIQQKMNAINVHINNFMLYFKEACLNIKENHETMYRCSYPPSYHQRRSAMLEQIHKEISLFSSIEDDEVSNFKLYYPQGKYCLFFYNVIQHHCKNMLDYLRNYFWHNYMTFFNILLSENMHFLIRCRANSKTDYETYLFDSTEIRKRIDPDFYYNLMHVRNLIPSKYEKNKKDTFYGEGTSQKGEADNQIDTGYMNDMTWLDLSDMLLYFLRHCNHVPIVRHVWNLFDEIMRKGGNPVCLPPDEHHREDNQKDAPPSKFILVDKGSLKLHRCVAANVWHLYKDIHTRLRMLIQQEKYEAFWALFFSPFNTKLTEHNVGTLSKTCNAPYRKFLRCLVTSRDFWVFLFLNLVGTIPTR